MPFHVEQMCDGSWFYAIGQVEGVAPSKARALARVRALQNRWIVEVIAA